MYSTWDFQAARRHWVTMVLTVQEKIEILEIWNEVKSNRKTAEIFNARNPNRLTMLNHWTVSKIRDQLLTHGTLHRKKKQQSAQAIVENAESKSEIIEHFRRNPHQSIRRAAAYLGKSHFFVWKTLKEVDFHPYKMAVHQKLLPQDHTLRREFCQQLLAMFQNDRNFQAKILWSDEKPFRVSDCFNRQNHR